MRHAEAVTFGGSALDRASEIRGDAEAVDRLARDPASWMMALWRGKPLVDGDALVRLPVGTPLAGGRDRILIGRDDGGAGLFAADLSHLEVTDAEGATDGFSDASRQTHPDLPGAFVELRGIMTRLSPRDAELAATARAVTGWHRSHRFCAVCGHGSEMIQAGWQRQCPSCGARHFPRTDPVVIMLITRGNDVLVGRSPGWPEGQYSLLAGFVEPGETIEAAVRREVFEESGVRVGSVGYLASQPWPFPASLMIGCHGEAISRDITLDPVELADARWVSREEMAAVFRGERPAMRPARPGAIAHFLIERWLSDSLD